MELFTNIRPETEAIIFAFLRKKTAAEKLHMLELLNRSETRRAKKMLRERYGNIDEKQLFRHLADLRLGEELALKVYGPPLSTESTGNDQDR
jgi:hypothetical protein